MPPSDRRIEIVNLIRQHGRVAVDELAKILHTSRETVRRDLTELARLGKVHKYHGGATLPMTTGEGNFRHRMGENVTAKVLIAEEAIGHFSPGETLFIDTGSTTLYFAEKLAEVSGLTVVTNSAEIARTLSLAGSQTRIFLLGGEFNGDNRQTVGSMAISQTGSFRAHHAVLTVGALDSRTGVMDFCINEAQVAQAMIQQAESLTILVDSSKFDRIASFKVCGLEQITNLICDRPPSNTLQAALQEAGVHVIPAKSR